MFLSAFLPALQYPDSILNVMVVETLEVMTGSIGYQTVGNLTRSEHTPHRQNLPGSQFEIFEEILQEEHF